MEQVFNNDGNGRGLISRKGNFKFLSQAFKDNSPPRSSSQSSFNIHSDDEDPQTSGNWLTRFFAKRKERETETQQSNPTPRSVTSTAKLMFANERTFLSWMQFCIIIGALSVAMLNYGAKSARISGFIFTLAACFIMFYALVQYHIRLKKLSQDVRGNYEDYIGSIIVVIVCIVSICFSFLLKLFL